MSTSTKTRQPEPRAGTESNSQPLSTFNPELMSNLAEASSACLRGVASLNREIAEFINKRLEHDAELGRALGRCKDWREAAELQQAWMREASEEYAANAKVMTELTSRFLTDTWGSIRTRNTGGSDPGGE